MVLDRKVLDRDRLCVRVRSGALKMSSDMTLLCGISEGIRAKISRQKGRSGPWGEGAPHGDRGERGESLFAVDPFDVVAGARIDL